MLEVLLESRGVRQPRPFAATVISAAAHAAAVVVIIAAGPKLFRDLTEPRDQQLSFLLPVDRGMPSPAQHLTYIATGGGLTDDGATKAEKKRVDPKGELALPQIKGESAVPVTEVPTPSVPQVADNAYSVVDVDSAAVRDPTSAAPAYPPVMMTKGIEGYAAMRFVVDTTGRIDMGTVELLQATHAEFVQAVREAMPHMRFRPAKMGTSVVRQLAEQQFKFEIRHVASSVEAPTNTKKPK